MRRASPLASRPSRVDRPLMASLLAPGRNCCAAARASRAAFLPDVDAYHRAFRQAAERATQSIVIVGWDFDVRTPLARDRRGRVRLRLGDFLNQLAKRRPRLEVYVLAWDYGALHRGEDEMRPLYGPGWHPHGRVHLHYDSTSAEASSHHQKIVVVDDAIAFCGGLDFTTRRAAAPVCEAMALVDGDAARSLADLARRRWMAATRQTMRPVARAADPWPPKIRADAIDVDVGISRTVPPSGSSTGTSEVEALYLDAIAAAKRSIYIENPHFTSARIADALADRLGEPDPPEVVVITHRVAQGWLGSDALDSARARLLTRLRSADSHRRFEAYYPLAEARGAACVDCDSSVMIVDDAWLHVGSAALTNRSMRHDSECGVTIEAGEGENAAAAIAAFRDALLAQRLASRVEALRERIAADRSLHAAIRSHDGAARGLRPIERADAPAAPGIDPEAAEPPVSLDALIREFSPETKEHGAGPAWGKLALIVVAIAALTAIWRYTPLSEVFTAERVIAWADGVGTIWWAPLVVMAAYTPACFVMFPRPLITLFAVIAFGPALGLAYSLLGIVSAALATYFVGCALPRDTVRKLAGEKLNEMTEVLRRRGLVAIFAVRIVPVAPFAIEGMVAGAVGIKLWHFALGTILGMLPGTLTTTVFGEQIRNALEDPSRINYWLVAGVALLFVGVIWVVRRWFLKEHRLAEAARAAA